MTTDFTQLNLQPQLVQAVIERGYQSPMPIQAAVIPVMIAGQDVIGQAQTGTGKTAAYALPLLQNLQPNQKHVQCLVVVPTRELALQVADAVNTYGHLNGARVLAVYGGAPYGPQINQLRRGADIVVGTPGRLMDLMDREILDISQVRTVVLDEADEMLSMGFVEDIETILAKTPAERQTALFSATLPPEIRRLADRYMRSPQSITIKSEHLTLNTTEQRYYVVHQGDKLAALTRLFEVEEITSALIFARTRLGTAELAAELAARGFPAEVLNGDLSQDAREQTMNRFRANRIKVLVATDVAARGLDVDGISHVFNFDLPDDPEIYVHRIGRTGRAGKTGIAISLVTPREVRNFRQIEGFTRQKAVRAVLPTDAEILKHREDELVNTLTMWLQRGRCKQERAIVERMVELGHDPLQIAATALKMARGEEKQRPIFPISEIIEIKEIKPAFRPREEFERKFETQSHEQGMVRLTINKGRKQGIRPNDIVGAIARHADIPGSAIGKIHIEDKYSLVDVPEDLVTQVLSKNGEVFIRRLPVYLTRAA